jgi:hypothetical protein
MGIYENIKEKIISQLTSEVKLTTTAGNHSFSEEITQFSRDQLYTIPRHCYVDYLREGLELAVHNDSLLLDDRHLSPINFELANVLQLLSIQLSVILVDVKRDKTIKIDMLLQALQRFNQLYQQLQHESPAFHLPLSERVQQFDLLINDLQAYNNLHAKSLISH